MGHGLGPPFLHVWVALIKAVGMSNKVSEGCKQVLAKYWEEKVKHGRTSLEEEVRHCRLKKAFKKGSF
eukprot:263724-Lingulodinium_polyedra.AAC.1